MMSEHFSYWEFIKSDTADKYDIDNTPSKKHIENGQLLAENVLEVLRSIIGEPLIVNSWFRSKKLNRKIGGSISSQHTRGQAIDITSSKTHDIMTLAKIMFKNDIPFDQLILENVKFGKNPIEVSRDSWLHISYKESGNRQRILAWQPRVGYKRILGRRKQRKVVFQLA